MLVKEIKSLLLKKGWAGRTISREETVSRLTPLFTTHVEQIRWYRHAESELKDKTKIALLAALQRQLRLNQGKLAETVYSCGGVVPAHLDRSALPYTGTAFWIHLVAREHSLRDQLLEEHVVDHQMRTEAVLTKCRADSEERLAFLRSCARSLRIAL